MQQITFTREVKQQWITALRSGDFRQGKSALWNSKDDTYCCLGVVGVLNGLVDGEGSSCSGGAVLLGSSLRGLVSGTQWDLALMNDEGDTFAEIADYIEKNVPAVDEE